MPFFRHDPGKAPQTDEIHGSRCKQSRGHMEIDILVERHPEGEGFHFIIGYFLDTVQFIDQIRSGRTGGSADGRGCAVGLKTVCGNDLVKDMTAQSPPFDVPIPSAGRDQLHFNA